LFKFMLRCLVFVGVSVGCLYTFESALDVPVFETIKDIALDAQQRLCKLGSESTGIMNSE